MSTDEQPDTTTTATEPDEAAQRLAAAQERTEEAARRVAEAAARVNALSANDARRIVGDVLQPAPEAPTRARFVFALPAWNGAQGAQGAAIHALRTGTFTDMYGRETTFTADDLQAIAERLNETTAKRRPPINERHDFGRAVGRMLGATTKYSGNHLYITPKWNQMGQSLLADEVYDGFSIELESHPKGGWQAIGGALTNYPAVSGLAAVTLSASPGADAVSTYFLPPADDPDTTENPPMSDTPTPAPAPEALPPLPTVPSDDPIVAQQVAAYAAQIQAQFRAQHEQVLQQAQSQALAQFERWKAEQAAQQAMLSFAQHVTTPTVDRPHALAYTVEQVTGLLSGLSAEKRAAVQQLITDAVEGSLVVAHDRIGSAAAGPDSDGEKWAGVIAAYQAQGMSKTAALKAAIKAHPALYAAQTQQKGGR